MEELESLCLNYEVEWPLSLVISPAHLQTYNKVFRFLFKLKRISFLLRDVWIVFKDYNKFSRTRRPNHRWSTRKNDNSNNDNDDGNENNENDTDSSRRNVWI